MDNALWGGSVADSSDQRPDTVAIRDLNAKALQDPRVSASLVRSATVCFWPASANEQRARDGPGHELVDVSAFRVVEHLPAHAQVLVQDRKRQHVGRVAAVAVVLSFELGLLLGANSVVRVSRGAQALLPDRRGPRPRVARPVRATQA